MELLMPPKDADETANSKDIDQMIWVCTVNDPDETANSKDTDQMIWVCTVCPILLSKNLGSLLHSFNTAFMCLLVMEFQA